MGGGEGREEEKREFEGTLLTAMSCTATFSPGVVNFILPNIYNGAKKCQSTFIIHIDAHNVHVMYCTCKILHIMYSTQIFIIIHTASMDKASVII